jgi:hypothetical protein
MKKFLYCLAPTLLLYSCINGQSNISTSKISSESKNLFQVAIIDLPSSYQGPIIRGDGQSIAYWNYEDSTALRKPEDISIIADKPSDLCSIAITGASKMTELTGINGKAEWGKADLQELEKQEGYIAPFNTENVKCGGAPHVYALCSRKNDRTVVICINQQQDNPELAKQIFETFRWTD